MIALFMPWGAAPCPIDEIAARRWNILAGDLPFPIAVLKDSALRHNIGWMENFARERGVRIAPQDVERFREDFDKFPEFVESDLFERILCPRMHMKAVIADGRIAYIGSANLTGAGLGAKGDHRRNFEAGIVTEDRSMIAELMEFLDTFYLGDHCLKCQRRDVCPDPIA